MATEKREVSIMAWPKEAAKLEHSFDSKKPCPVSIVFEENPANVVIHTTPDTPFNVDMNMKVTAKDTIPVCVKLCEPICAKSDYTIGIDIFDRPVGTIRLKGMTRLFNCREPQEYQEELVCVDFENLKETVYSRPLTYKTLTFSPLGGQITVKELGEPTGRLKLVFPTEGMRIDFPFPVSDVSFTVNNYSSSKELNFSVFSGETLVNSFTETIDNEVKRIDLAETAVTAIEMKGGQFEASLVQICYRSI